VYHWRPKNEKLNEAPHAVTYKGSEDVKAEALKHVLALNTRGGTNINDGMLEAVSLVKQVRRSETIPANARSIIIFLTDGEPTTGVTSGDEIRANVAEVNADTGIPIYGLAFGSGADYGLIKSLSAFARKIYEASDAAIQLEDFYLQIASPKLSNVKIYYVGEAVHNGTFSDSTLDTFNAGNELVITGKIDEAAEEEIEVIIEGQGKHGPFNRKLTLCRPLPPKPMPIEILDDGKESLPMDDTSQLIIVDPLLPVRPIFPTYPEGCIPLPPKPLEPWSDAQNFVERLWAFKTIKGLLKKADEEKKDQEGAKEEHIDKNENIEDVMVAELQEDREEDGILVRPKVTPKKSSKQKALELAFKYNFVTPLTSLVVTRPKSKATKPVDEEEMDEEESSQEVNEEEEEEPKTMERTAIDPVPVSHSLTSNSAGRGSMGRIASSSILPRLGAGVYRSSSVNYGLRNRGSPLPPPPPPSPASNSNRASISFLSKSGPQSTTYDMDSYDYDDEMFGSRSALPARTTTTGRPTCSGSISFHSQTYLRGENVTLNMNMNDLTSIPSSIAQKLTSLQVHGDCCWFVFTKTNFGGSAERFSPGPSKSASTMGAVFRAAKSLRKFNC
jgi:hypothetical protein